MLTHAKSSTAARSALPTECDRLNLLITLIVRCLDNTAGMMRKSAFYRSGDIFVFDLVTLTFDFQI